VVEVHGSVVAGLMVEMEYGQEVMVISAVWMVCLPLVS
jgi:hypothetical protein